jgi:hypothetical protein
VSGPVVHLSGFDVHLAAFVGNSRAVSALRDGRPLEDGRRDLSFERHVEGALGEYAVAIALDRVWRPAVGRLDTDAGDVGPIQVKATLRRDGCLIVRPHDPAGLFYVLAVLTPGRGGIDVALPGWTVGDEAKQPEYWCERDPARGVHRAAYFVPQADLFPLSCLSPLPPPRTPAA